MAPVISEHLIQSLTYIAVISFTVSSALLYGSNPDTLYYGIDPTTGEPYMINPSQCYQSRDIVYDTTTGKMYTAGTGGGISEIDVCTGEDIVCQYGTPFQYTALEFVGTTLYGVTRAIPGSGAVAQLYEIDPISGAATFVASLNGFIPDATGYPSINIPGMAYEPNTNTMYAITGTGKAICPSILIVIDLTSGLTTPIGFTGICTLASLTIDDSGTLYALGNADPGNQGLFTVNKISGAATVVGPSIGGTGIEFVDDATPCPTLDTVYCCPTMDPTLDPTSEPTTQPTSDPTGSSSSDSSDDEFIDDSDSSDSDSGENAFALFGGNKNDMNGHVFGENESTLHYNYVITVGDLTLFQFFAMAFLLSIIIVGVCWCLRIQTVPKNTLTQNYT